MKKSPLFLIISVLTGCFSTLSLLATDPPRDAWVQRYRLLEDEKPTTLTNEKGETIKFFNGFSIGASAGLALFHGSLADYNMFAPFSDFSTYYKFGWRVYASKEIKYGLKAKLVFEKGTLEGGRIIGLQSPKITFRSEYSTLAAVAGFDVLGDLFLKNPDKPSKTYLDVEIGIGVTFFRSLSFWTGNDERVRDFVGYTVTDNNPPTQRYTTEERTKPAVALNIPVGFTFGYRVNYKTDVTFSYTLNNLATDRLDTFDRSWSANDKYSYFGLGLRYNFNRDKDDYPKKKKKKKDDKKADREDSSERKWRLFGSKNDDVRPNDVQLNGDIESRKSNKIVNAEQEKNMEEVRMKMFELQLKLFEMQYLINGSNLPPSGK